jgi:predicted ATP-grasp superfamily ATP-dependent carboligase
VTDGAASAAAIDSSVPVVVLKMAVDYYAHGRLGVIRSLGRRRVAVHSLLESRLNPAAWSRFGAEHLVWPVEDLTPAAALATLVRLGDRLGGRPVLVATDDVGAVFVAQHDHELRARFRFPEQPKGLAERLCNKHDMYALCKEHDVPTPEVLIPDGPDDLTRAVESLGLPVIIKSMDPDLLRQRPEARSVVIARDLETARDVFDRAEDWGEPNLMLQEYVPGGPDSVWMLNGYFDADSRCRVAFTGQKVRQYPHNTGATTLGVCRDNPDVVAMTRRLFAAIGYRGIVDMGYRYDARDAQYKLLDVNPRLGATFRLFVDEHGLDVVRALYLDLTGQPIPAQGRSEGRRWWVEPLDVQTFGDYRREDGLTFGSWLRSVLRVEERAWFAWDDPMPFVAMAALFAGQASYRRLAGSGRAGAAARRVGLRVRRRLRGTAAA